MKLLFSSFAVAAIALSACQPVGTRNDGVHGGNLRINISDIPHRVFPGYAEKRSEQIIVNQVYTGLVKYNQHTLQIVPSIAREHKLSPDELTYTFLLDTRGRYSVLCSFAILGSFTYTSVEHVAQQACGTSGHFVAGNV